MRPELFIKCTEILDEQRRRNPDFRYIFEVGTLHPALMSDGDKQETLVGDKLHLVQGSDLGLPSSRPRRCASNMATPQELTKRDPLGSEIALGSAVFPAKHPMFCLVSK